jgi:hypothetical protein
MFSKIAGKHPLEFNFFRALALAVENCGREK